MRETLTVPHLIEGAVAVDDRGQITFANDFDFAGVKRFYMVENFSTDVVRAWHGHKTEAKFVFVSHGAAIVAAVEMDHEKTPKHSNQIHRYVLSARKPAILFLPAGYANGFRPLETDTKIIFFSTSTLDESKGDDHRFPADYWGQTVWQVEYR